MDSMTLSRTCFETTPCCQTGGSIAFIFSIVVLKNWPQLDTPLWTIFFAIGLNLDFLIPMSYLFSISGSTQRLNVITELVVGYALPGRPEALLFVKAFGYNINGQADTYISDQKMGFHAKVPPHACSADRSPAQSLPPSSPTVLLSSPTPRSRIFALQTNHPSSPSPADL